MDQTGAHERWCIQCRSARAIPRVTFFHDQIAIALQYKEIQVDIVGNLETGIMAVFLGKLILIADMATKYHLISSIT